MHPELVRLGLPEYAKAMHEAGEARLLAFLGEFDARGQWAGYPSCASWLSWRLTIGLKAASEKVRVARALRVLPVIRAAFERGEVSYTQVRALTRVARPDSEAELLVMGRCCSGEQIERHHFAPYPIEQRERLRNEDTLTLPVGTPLEEVERQMIMRTLQKTKNNKTRAAELLGISLKTLHNKLNLYRERGLLHDE